MAVPTGTVTMQDIQDEHGGSHPISLSEYYGVDTGVPASGTISMDDLRGTSAIQELTITEGSFVSGLLTQWGFSIVGPYGGISSPGSINGAAVNAMYYQQSEIKGNFNYLFLLQLAGVRAKSFFTSLAMPDSTGDPVWTSASAIHSDNGSVTTWQWATNNAYLGDWNGSGTQRIQIA